MGFEHIIGQTDVKRILRETIAGERIGHAYLFYGADGIGRKTVAREFASLIMCTNPTPEGERCGSCEACVLNRTLTNPDYVFVDVPPQKSTIGVDAVRQMQDDMYTAPLYSKKKVYLINHAEKITPEAQNALLKTLEEPPVYVVILLICSNISLMLDTVKSRVTRVDFARYTNAEIAEALREKKISEEELSVICAYADGLIGRAKSYFEDTDADEIRDHLLRYIESTCTGKTRARIEAADYVIKEEARKEFVFFTLMSFYRDIAVSCRYGKRVKLQNVKEHGKIFEIGKKIGFYKAEACLLLLDETWKQIIQNVNYKLAVGNMFIKIQEVFYA